MDFPRDPPKPKSVTSFFFGKKQKTPMHIPNNLCNAHLEPGLKTLTTNDNSNRSLSCVNRTKILSSASSSFSSLSSFLSSPSSCTSSSPLSSSPSMDEIKYHDQEIENPYPTIRQNTEKQEEEEEREEKEKEKTCKKFSGRRLKSSMTGKRQYPPPIPMLAQTENLPCHMPFVYKRSSSVGRLVIQEVRVKHHEFFLAHRSNGRLTLQLIQLEDKVFPSRPKQENSEQVDAKAEEEDKENPEHIPEHPQKIGVNLKTPEKIDEKKEENDENQKEKIQSLHKNAGMVEDNERRVGKEDNKAENMASSSSSNEDDNAEMKSPLLILPRRLDNDQDGKVENQPSILPSSISDSSLIGMGPAVGCFTNRNSSPLFQMPIPTIWPVHS